MKTRKHDLIVVGGGAGGTATALRAAQLGGKVALIEKNHLGGFCMNRGCIPFSHMAIASDYLHKISTLAREMGIEAGSPKLNLSVLNRRQDELIKGMREGIRGLLTKSSVNLISGDAQFVEPHTVIVAGQEFTAENIVIATGSKWASPRFEGRFRDRVFDGDYVLSLRKVSETLLIYSDNPFSLQAAQFLARNGATVYLVTTKRRLLYWESKTISSRITKILREQGIHVLTGTSVASCANKRNGLEVTVVSNGEEKAIVVDKLIYMKKVADFEELGLDRIGLQADDYLEVNERMETSVRGVYAVGDVAAPEQLHYSHLASAGGLVAAQNCMGRTSYLDHRSLPRILYTTPQIACIGLSPKDAKARGYKILTGMAPLNMNPFGMIMFQVYGLIELIADKDYGEILGINMIGDEVCEMAGEAVLAIQLEATVDDLASALFPHPTLSESLSEAARDCLGATLYIPQSG